MNIPLGSNSTVSICCGIVVDSWYTTNPHQIEPIEFQHALQNAAVKMGLVRHQSKLLSSSVFVRPCSSQKPLSRTRAHTHTHTHTQKERETVASSQGKTSMTVQYSRLCIGRLQSSWLSPSIHPSLINWPLHSPLSAHPPHPCAADALQYWCRRVHSVVVSPARVSGFKAIIPSSSAAGSIADESLHQRRNTYLDRSLC